MTGWSTGMRSLASPQRMTGGGGVPCTGGAERSLRSLGSRSMRIRSIVAALAIALLAGCSSPVADDGDPDTFETVEALRAAYVEAGGNCPEWQQTDAIELAAQSGDCSGDTVLSIYATTADRDEVVGYLTEAMADIGGPTLLVGKNWMINTPDPAATADALGGQVIAIPTE